MAKTPTLSWPPGCDVVRPARSTTRAGAVVKSAGVDGMSARRERAGAAVWRFGQSSSL
jgi:hypothetical protein